jgi:hypothetical protein
MKTYILTTLLAGALLVTSCADDRDSNPTINQPETFTLNTPALAGNTYDLENSESITFTYKQPNYGYTAPVIYYTQVALNDTWVDATDDTDASYIELDGSVTTCESEAAAKDINKAIMKLAGYGDESQVPETQDLYVRMRATLAAGYQCYSNTVKLTVKPYYASLVAADPELWYLIGGCIGDGSWGSEIGVAVFPMSPVDGYEFDDNGLGQLTYTGYFPSDKGFKIVKTPGEWADQWGADGGDFNTPRLKDNDGEGSDFYVTESGYWKILLDTKANTLTFTKVDDVTPYEALGISGDFNVWAYQDMKPVGSVDSHIWTIDFEATEEGGLKFLKDGWSPNWGSLAFPFGFGTNGGPNIPVLVGDYRIIFNDIDGYYHFYSL